MQGGGQRERKGSKVRREFLLLQGNCEVTDVSMR